MESAFFSLFVLLALSGCSRISVEGLWTSSLVGESSVGLGWKQYLHSMFIPSLEEGYGRLQWGWVQKLSQCITGCAPAGLRPSEACDPNILNSLLSSVISFLCTSGYWLCVLGSDFLESVDRLQCPGLQVLTNHVLPDFWPNCPFLVYPSCPWSVGLLPPPGSGTSSMLFPLSGMLCLLFRAWQILILENSTLSQLGRFFIFLE